jgi:hypothetical protein
MQRLSRKEYPKRSAELERLFQEMLKAWAKKSGGAGARVPEYLGVAPAEPAPTESAPKSRPAIRKGKSRNP